MTDQLSCAGDERRFVTFFLDGLRYAIDILVVREVHRPLGVTPARAPHAFVRGMVNLRGQIITVLDPAQRLGLAARVASDDARLVILKTTSELRARGLAGHATTDDSVALWVDRISDVVVPGPRGIEAPPASLAAAPGGDLVQGVIQLESELVRVLDPLAMVAIDGEVSAAA